MCFLKIKMAVRSSPFRKDSQAHDVKMASCQEVNDYNYKQTSKKHSFLQDNNTAYQRQGKFKPQVISIC